LSDKGVLDIDATAACRGFMKAAIVDCLALLGVTRGLKKDAMDGAAELFAAEASPRATLPIGA
jgi:hypothetical protein